MCLRVVQALTGRSCKRGIFLTSLQVRVEFALFKKENTRQIYLLNISLWRIKTTLSFHLPVI